MADYCRQCSIELFGEDFKDMAGLVTEEQEADYFVATVICEGCGPTDVNRSGECMWHEKSGGSSLKCYEAGKTGATCTTCC